MTDNIDQPRLAQTLDAYNKGRLDRRGFLRGAALAGVGFAAAQALSLAGGKAWAQSTRTVEAPRGADYIVIGAGSAGATVAGQLARTTGASVLVLEGGLSDDQADISDPAG